MLESGIYKKGEVELAHLIGNIISKDIPRDVGAVMIFMGITREIGKDDKKVLRIDMEAYEEQAVIKIRKICHEIKEKYNLSLVRIYHFVGSFGVGEPLVIILVAGKTRKQTFPALSEAIERYKKEPAVFKKEVYLNESYSWISGD